jgi:hypothetical protein
VVPGGLLNVRVRGTFAIKAMCDNILYLIVRSRKERGMTKMVIDGVAYDTEAATFIAMGEADPDGVVGSQASWSLYKTRLGAFFEVV